LKAAETAGIDETAVAYNDTVDADLICLVKIVRHEAANQSMTGQLAVAQLVMNRVNSPAFPNTICTVAHQRGQFFNTNAYNPARTDQRWRNAMQVALDARNQVSASVVEDAVFYHAAYVTPRFHRSRPRVTQIEDHIFYR
jgi:spore germination cell wall hydrolase CwlJ-like protein